MPTSPRAADAECAPVWTASTSTECVAEVGAEAIRKHGMNFAQTDSRGQEGTDTISTSAAERIPKPWFWRRSFLPFFRRRKKGSRRRQDAGDYGLPRARCALAMTWFLHEVRRKPGFRSSGRPTPVRRLPIDYRGEICTSLVWADRAVRPCKFIMTPCTISPTAFCSAHRCYALPGPHSVPGPDRR